MKTQIYERKTLIGASAEEVYEWHAREGAFERLVPPWDNVRRIESQGSIEKGARHTFEVRLGPARVRWTAEHGPNVPGREFRDQQVEGPFRFWEHVHRFEPVASNACWLHDRVEYALPLGILGHWVAGRSIRRKLDRMFAYRHEITKQDLAELRAYGDKKMKILVSGSHGLVGSALVPKLRSQGHEVVRLIRANAVKEKGTIEWDPMSGKVPAGKLEGFDAVIHLAGEGLATGRWTEAKKKRILDSRVVGTRALSEGLAKLTYPPKILISASAIGYYGDRGEESLTEQSESGVNFVSTVCEQWEAATAPASKEGIHVANLRFGVILSPKGGALKQMMTPFKLGLGGRLGSGKQWMSWIAIDDVLSIIQFVLNSGTMKGPINVVTPEPITNADFTHALGEVLHRPTILPMPGFAARLVFGQMADELLLASTRVLPYRLKLANYNFLYPNLDQALRHLLGEAESE